MPPAGGGGGESSPFGSTANARESTRIGAGVRPLTGLDLWCIPYGMKVTFEIPEPVVRTLRARVESGKRSGLVTKLLETHLARRGSALADAARKANTFERVTCDMRDWEALNGYDH